MKDYMVIDTDSNKVVFEGNYFECSRYITVTAMNGIFIGDTSTSKYQIKHKQS